MRIGQVSYRLAKESELTLADLLAADRHQAEFCLCVQSGE
jgi:hypothetical protein